LTQKLFPQPKERTAKGGWPSTPMPEMQVGFSNRFIMSSQSNDIVVVLKVTDHAL
jgi:hypothetical protein